MMRAAVAVLLCVCASVEGWTSGDFVPITVRSRFGTEETSPRDLGHDLSPRFGKNKGVHVKSLSHASIGGGDFKVQFELGHGLGRRTQWITVQSGCQSGPKTPEDKCYRLSYVKFIFRYEMNDYGKIVDFKAETNHHETAPHTMADDHVVLSYEWIQDHDKDMHTALLSLYSVSVVASVVLISFMFVSSESVRRGQMLVKDLRSQ